MTSSDDADASLDRFFDGYVENALSRSEQAELGQWLGTSRAHVDQFVLESFLHCQLFEIVRQRTLHADVMAVPSREADRVAAAIDRAPAQVPARVGRRPALRAWAGWALAASVLLSAGLAVWSYLALRPQALAQLTQATADLKFEPGAGSFAVGALLYEGDRLRLRRGRLLATLVSGARVIVQAPAEVHVIGPNAISLVSGRCGAEVPVQAIGFTMQTPAARFVDLGTEFTVDAQPKRWTLNVFTGLVEAQPLGDENPLRVTEGRAVSCETASGEVTVVEYDERQKLSM